MNNLQDKLRKIIDKLPNPKQLFAIITVIITAIILYIVILFLTWK